MTPQIITINMRNEGRRCSSREGSADASASLPRWLRSVTGRVTQPLVALGLIFTGCFSSQAFSVSGSSYQSNGSASDTQAAIDAAPNGATVQIPNGTYTWSSQVRVNKAITFQGASAGGVLINNTSSINGIIDLTESTAGSVVMANITMADTGVSGSLGTLHHVVVEGVTNGQPVLMHDCTFYTGGSALVYAVDWGVNRGVVWSCTFDSKFNYGGGIQLKGQDNSSWSTPSTLGTADTNGAGNTYVEDCVFKTSYLGALDFDDNSRTVVRNCTFQDSAIYCHGQDTSPEGARQWEVYNNRFTYTASGPNYPLNLQDWFTVRGGTGVIFGNNFDSILYKRTAVQLNVYSINRGSATIPCQTSYPAPRQVGQTWVGVGVPGAYAYANAPYDNKAGAGYKTDPIYIWGNSGAGASDPDFVSLNQYTPDDCGNGQRVGDYVKEGRDYILGSARPGYTAYTYPHPLRHGGSTQPGGSPGQSAPTQPTNLRVVQ
jgi:hypothetical protein